MQNTPDLFSSYPQIELVIYYSAASVLATYALWVFFLAVMNLKQAKDEGKLPALALKFGYPVLFIGYLLDALVQFTVANFIFGELPRESTVSSRVKRLIASGNGWRKVRAEWFRDTLLSPFDRSGGHG